MCFVAVGCLASDAGWLFELERAEITDLYLMFDGFYNGERGFVPSVVTDIRRNLGNRRGNRRKLQLANSSCAEFSNHSLGLLQFNLGEDCPLAEDMDRFWPGGRQVRGGGSHALQ
jgi:hypothetical protein